MPRIAEGRPPATPATDDQRARRTAILRAATRLGRAKSIEHIAAQEIAAEAGVALRTLYRYYPSKYHVFAAVLIEQVDRVKLPAQPAAEGLARFMGEACRAVLRHKHLAHAMIISTQAVRARTGATGYRAMRNLILQVAAVENPTEEQIRTARLLEQVTFGVLSWAVSGELNPEQAVADVETACMRLAAGHL